MDNLRGSLFMVLAMALFAIEDMFIKQMSGTLPVGQILWMLGGGGAIVFAAWERAAGRPLWTRAMLHGGVLGRTACEMVGTVGFVTALALTPISSASAILQAVPLVVTLGAALFLGESVGWRRWTAIFVGLLGVLVILRPGMDGFRPASLFAVMGVIGLAGRDIVTRLAPGSVTAGQFSVSAFLGLVPTGLLLLLLSGEGNVAPDTVNAVRIAGSIVIGTLAYASIVIATRTGSVAHVAPFRYSRIVFALTTGYFVFGERPDAWTYVGIGIVVGSGVYTFLREARTRPVPPASLARGGRI